MFVFHGVPFIGFGMLDNMIMILAVSNNVYTGTISMQDMDYLHVISYDYFQTNGNNILSKVTLNKAVYPSRFS